MEEEVLLKLKSTFPSVEFATHILNVIDEVEYISKEGVDNDIDIRLSVSKNKLYRSYVYNLSIGIIKNKYYHNEVYIEGDVLDEVLNEVKDELITIYNSIVELLKLMGVLN